MEKPFRVFWINSGYFSQESFADIESAISYGKSKGFEFTVWEYLPNEFDSILVASWSIFGGTRYYGEP